MSHPTLLLTATPIATLALGVTAASAAQIAVDRGCYADPAQRSDVITLSGAGFTAGGAFQATLDGQALTGGTGTADAGGAIAATLGAPSLEATVGKGTLQHTYTLGVQEGPNAATTQFTVSKLFATFKPSSGNPKTLKVRFSLYGFGLAGAVAPPIYLHYVQPNGKLKRTYRLGTGQGACGSLTTSRRRLFPFAPRRGAWKLQFDTSKRYVRGVGSSTFLFYTLGVTVKAKRR